VTIRVIRPGTPEQVKTFMEPAIEEFENENPNINVEPIYQGWSGYFNRLNNWIASGDQPHVVMLNDYLQPQMLDQGVPLQRADIEDRLNDDVAEQNVAYDTVAINDGEHYVVPACVGSFIYYYRKDNFEEAGLDPEDPPLDTYDDLFSTALPTLQENTDAAPIGVPLGGTTGAVNSFWSQFYAAWTGNDSWLDSVNGDPQWTSDAAIEGTTQYKETKAFAADGATSSGRGAFRPVHIAGDVSLHFDGPWVIPSMTEEFGEDLSDSPIGFSVLPEGPAGRGSNVGMDGWAVMRDENVDEAFKLVNKLASKDVQAMHDQNYGCVPARQDEADEVDFFQNEPWPTLFNAVDDGIRRLYHTNASEVNNTMMEQLQSYWVGNTSAQAAMETASQQARQG
jgi:ABC-type glycerol-3-phosphate transport system substrate-binding protein